MGLAKGIIPEAKCKHCFHRTVMFMSTIRYQCCICKFICIAGYYPSVQRRVKHGSSTRVNTRVILG